MAWDFETEPEFQRDIGHRAGPCLMREDCDRESCSPDQAQNSLKVIFAPDSAIRVDRFEAVSFERIEALWKKRSIFNFAVSGRAR